jgi:phosphoglycolate phosphatase
MLEAAMAETGARAAETVVVGDTTFDVEMARAAGALPVGVAWGNHPPDELHRAGAVAVLGRFAELLTLLR